MRKLALHHQAAALIMIVIFITAMIVPSTGNAAVSPDMDRMLKSIMTYQFSQSRVDLIGVENGVRAALGNTTQLRDIESRFSEMLKSPNSTYECKDFICRQLAIMGTDLTVPVLADMLTSEEYSDMARYALERNPSTAAGQAFRNAFPKAEGMVLIGIVNSLGERQDVTMVPAISELVFGEDEELALAAVDALGKMGNSPEAATTLARARREGSEKINKAAGLAILRMADETFK